MTEKCALEIMQQNNMIKIENRHWLHRIAKEQYPDEIIKELKIPIKRIHIKQDGEEFDLKFRELMKQSGYICTPTKGYGASELFIKKEDIDNFINGLPEEEEIYTDVLNYLIYNYIQDNYQHIKLQKHVMYTGHGNHKFQGKDAVTSITNLNLKKQRIEQESQKEKDAIKFMEQLFH